MMQPCISRGGMLLLVTVAASAAFAGCDFPTGCDADLQVRMTPPAHTLRVGEQFRPTATAYGCGGTRPRARTWIWSAVDTAVVRVGAGTGTVTALRTGSTQVIANATDGLGFGEVAVTVIP